MAFAESDDATIEILDLPDELLSLVLLSASPPTPELTVHNARWAVRWHRLSHRDHPAHSIINAKRRAVGIRSVCSRFRAALPKPPGVRLINSLSHLNLPRRHNPHAAKAGSNTWIPEEVMLHPKRPTIFAYEVRADSSQSEVIGAFSHSCRPWAGGGAGEDALTWYAAPHSDGFSFRTRMFDWTRGFVRGTRHCNRVRLLHARWHLVEVRAQREAPRPRTRSQAPHLPRQVRMTTGRAAYWIDGTLVAEARIGEERWVEESETASGRERVWVCPEEGIDRLRPGRFGMVTWQSDYSWRNGVILHA